VHQEGARVRLSANFYVLGDEGITFHGDEGSLELGSWFAPRSPLTHKPYGETAVVIETPEGAPELDWSVGVAELVAAISEDRPSRLNRDQAVHMVDILESVTMSASSGAAVELTTTFQPF
jgi:predicted dehydrogenase